MPAFKLFAKLAAYYVVLGLVIYLALRLFPGVKDYLPVGGVEALISQPDANPLEGGARAATAQAVGSMSESLFWLSAAILLFYGAFDGVSVVVRSTILQLATPDEMRGRVSSINGLFISSSNELGAFYAGTMARWLGLVPAVVLGGCAVLGVAGITAWKNPILRRLNLRDLH